MNHTYRNDIISRMLLIVLTALGMVVLGVPPVYYMLLPTAIVTILLIYELHALGRDTARMDGDTL